MPPPAIIRIGLDNCGMFARSRAQSDGGGVIIWHSAGKFRPAKNWISRYSRNRQRCSELTHVNASDRLRAAVDGQFAPPVAPINAGGEQ